MRIKNSYGSFHGQGFEMSIQQRYNSFNRTMLIRIRKNSDKTKNQWFIENHILLIF